MAIRAIVLRGAFTLDQFALRPPSQAGNTEEWASLPLHYSDSVGCKDCHKETYEGWLGSAHGSVSCENCHGPALAHTEDSDVPVAINRSPELCELCHGQLPAKPSGFPQIQASEHYQGSACTSCHSPHRPGPAPIITHQAQGECLRCHSLTAVEARPIPPDHAGRTSDQCLDCHESE